ncbi:Smr/MutS family protein [Desulforegula conservatrix]|uniref:Smr/MutS family protein n=1 Tax=Desulforegula conservatrix TaxID=153026 RepID=UPI000406D1D3|nr:Smr/MutS family protein [Desulforegula conservatrix]
MFSELARFFGLKTSQKIKQIQEKTIAIEKESTEPKKTVNEEPVNNQADIVNDSVQIAKITEKPQKKIAGNKKSKNGLPVLSENFDFSTAFSEEHEDNSYINTEKQEHTEIPEIIVKQSEPAPLKAKKMVPIKTDRKGIPKLSSVHDLEALMISGIEGIERTEIPQAPKRTNTDKPIIKPLKDKNRIPILSETIDLTKVFGSDSDQRFHDLLSKNLEGKSKNALLREKKEKTEKPMPVPVEQRIKRYPGPQEDLDLHGFTAIEADRKTDIFIRSARRRGLFTVKIIVGKGTHSQGRAVLPDVVEDRLAALKNEKEILTFRWEKRLKTQSGSVIAYLNQYD